MLLACVLGLAAVRRRGTWFLVGAIGVSFVTFSAHWRRSTPSGLLMVALLGSDRRRHEGDCARQDYRLTAATLAGLQVFVLLMVLLLRVQILGYVFNTSPPENPSTAYLAFVNNPIQFAEPLPARHGPAGGRDGSRAADPAAAAVGGLLLRHARHGHAARSGRCGCRCVRPDLSRPGGLDGTAVPGRHVRSELVRADLPGESAVSDRNVFGERLLYLPSIGFALLLAAAFERLADSGGGRRRAACCSA